MRAVGAGDSAAEAEPGHVAPEVALQPAATQRGEELVLVVDFVAGEQLFATLRGRGLKGDLWRYVTRIGLGRAIAGTDRSQPPS